MKATVLLLLFTVTLVLIPLPTLSVKCCHRVSLAGEISCTSQMSHDWCFTCERTDCRLMDQPMPKDSAYGLQHIDGIQEGCKTYDHRVDHDFHVLSGFWCFCRSVDFCNEGCYRAYLTSESRQKSANLPSTATVAGANWAVLAFSLPILLTFH